MEVWYGRLRLAANYYVQLSGWKDSKDYTSYFVEEQPSGCPLTILRAARYHYPGENSWASSTLGGAFLQFIFSHHCHQPSPISWRGDFRMYSYQDLINSYFHCAPYTRSLPKGDFTPKA